MPGSTSLGRLAPSPAEPSLPPRPALTLSPRISPRCSCKRRFTSRMRLLWSSIALTFSASARRRLRISSSLLHCSSSSSDTLDRSSTAAAAAGPAGAGGQLSAAAAAALPAAFDMIAVRWQVRVGGRGKATPKGAGAAGPPPPTPLCAPASQRHRPGAAGLGRQGSRRAAILPRHPCARARAPPGPGIHPRAAARARPNSAQVHGAGCCAAPPENAQGAPRRRRGAAPWFLSPLLCPVSKLSPPHSRAHTHEHTFLLRARARRTPRRLRGCSSAAAAAAGGLGAAGRPAAVLPPPLGY